MYFLSDACLLSRCFGPRNQAIRTGISGINEFDTENLWLAVLRRPCSEYSSDSSIYEDIQILARDELWSQIRSRRAASFTAADR